jgi:hypothetical protein
MHRYLELDLKAVDLAFPGVTVRLVRLTDQILIHVEQFWQLAKNIFRMLPVRFPVPHIELARLE